jgi:hypothetical protein
MGYAPWHPASERCRSQRFAWRLPPPMTVFRALTCKRGKYTRSSRARTNMRRPAPCRTPNTNHGGLALAIQEGWFRDAGLDVRLVSPHADNYEATPASRLEAGTAQFAIVPSESVISWCGCWGAGEGAGCCAWGAASKRVLCAVHDRARARLTPASVNRGLF